MGRLATQPARSLAFDMIRAQDAAVVFPREDGMRMSPRKFLKRALFSAFALAASATLAAAGCTDWMDQGNGTSWAMCVGDDGVQHCWLINNTPGSSAYEVSCSN